MKLSWFSEGWEELGIENPGLENHLHIALFDLDKIMAHFSVEYEAEIRSKFADIAIWLMMDDLRRMNLQEHNEFWANLSGMLEKRNMKIGKDPKLSIQDMSARLRDYITQTPDKDWYWMHILVLTSK